MTPEELKAKCIARYSTFCSVMQGPGWFDPVHGRLCDWVQFQVFSALEANKKRIEETGNLSEDEIIKINLVMPRGSLKTTIVTKYFPVWMNLQKKFPTGEEGCNIRSLIATNTMPNARKKLDDIRGLYDSHKTFQGLFPELIPRKSVRDSDSAWTSERAIINRTMAFPDATYEAAGTGTSKTGSHYNIILEDDTVAPKESDMKGSEFIAPSMEDIEKGIGFHKAGTYLLVPKGVRIRMVITTRWSEDDLVSYIRENEDYKFFDIPAQDENGRSVFSMFYSENTLKDLEKQAGPYMFSCLYLNSPMDASLRKFKKEWFDTIAGELIPEGKEDRTYPTFRTIAVDPAISEKNAACETAITEVKHVIQDKEPHQYWMQDVHGHMNPFEQVNKLLDIAEASPDEVKALIIEANAYQLSLKYYIYDAMAKRGVHYPVLPITSTTGKDARIEGMIPYFATKRIHFIKGCLTPQVESQLRQFPNGRLKDIIDSFSFHLKVSNRESKIIPPRPKAKRTDVNVAEEIINQAIAEHNRINGTKAGSLTPSYKTSNYSPLTYTNSLSTLEHPEVLASRRLSQ